jgi:heme oxygenase
VLKLTPGCGNAYFRGFEERTGALWLEFSKVLERTVDDRDSEEAIASAKEMFAVFEAWMLQARVATEQTSRVRD